MISDLTTFHILLTGAIVLPLLILIIHVLFFIFFYLRRNNKLQEKVDYLEKQMAYCHRLFDEHFKTTDKTVLDVRKERDGLKKEVKRLKKLVGEK